MIIHNLKSGQEGLLEIGMVKHNLGRDLANQLRFRRSPKKGIDCESQLHLSIRELIRFLLYLRNGHYDQKYLHALHIHLKLSHSQKNTKFRHQAQRKSIVFIIRLV